jgi:chromosome segregation ATPase
MSQTAEVARSKTLLEAKADLEAPVKDSFDADQEVQDALGQSEEVVKGLENQVANLTHEKRQEQAMKERVQAALEKNQSPVKDTAGDLEKTSSGLADTQTRLQATAADLLPSLRSLRPSPLRSVSRCRRRRSTTRPLRQLRQLRCQRSWLSRPTWLRSALRKSN